MTNRLNKLIFGLAAAASIALLASAQPGQAQRAKISGQATGGGANVYPQFRAPGGQIVHWLPEQMPLKVYIAPGLTLDSLIDPQAGAPYDNVDNKDHWPDLVAGVVQHPEDFKNLQMAEGYVPQQFDAAKEGISSWKPFGNGIFSFQFVDDPSDADIYVFWTKHFVNKLGMALFQNDIRGYTGKRSFPLKQIKQTEASGVAPSYLRPVVSFLRTTDGAGNPMPLSKMKASAAHEFGHALGIEQHSENPIDLMSVYYGHGVVSPNDAATIRYLYHLTPDYVP